MDARQGIKATNIVTFCAEGRRRRDRRQPLQFDRFCLILPLPAKPYSLKAMKKLLLRGRSDPVKAFGR